MPVADLIDAVRLAGYPAVLAWRADTRGLTLAAWLSESFTTYPSR